MYCVVVGRGLEASRAVIARLLASRPSSGALVLDYRGAAERLLSPSEIDALRSLGCRWVDVGDLQRPFRLLDIPNGDASEVLLARQLRRYASVLSAPLRAEDVAYAHAFLKEVWKGTCSRGQGLADLRATIANDELAHWAWPGKGLGRPTEEARRRILDLLGQILRYPHMAASSIAPVVSVDDAAPRWTWIEVPEPHLERVEWLLASMALHGLADKVLAHVNRSDPPACVLLHPPSDPRLAEAFPDGPAGDVIITIASHPSGNPPRLLERWLREDMAIRLELAGPIPRSGLTRWREMIGSAAGQVHELPAGKAAAFVRMNHVLERVSPRLLPWTASPLQVPPLVDLRAAARRDRPPVTSPHLVTAALPQGSAQVSSPDPFSRLCQSSTFLFAWYALAASGTAPSPGMDGVVPSMFASRAEQEAATLAAEMSEGRYQPTPPVWTEIPKATGGTRRIGICAVRDRVAQRAFLDLSEPYFEPHFSDRSFAFRPGRSAHHAVMTVLDGLRRGFSFVAHVDVKSCFDNLPHETILSRFAQRVPSPGMVSLLARWLRFGQGFQSVPASLGVGVVQGWVLSPFLSNIVLDDLDHHLEHRGVEFARFADDISILARTEKEAIDWVEWVESVLASRLAMSLNRKKTCIQSFTEGADFLGFRIGGPGLLAIAPSRFIEARQEAIERVRALPGRQTARLIVRLGQHFEGQAGYFCRLGMTRALHAQFDEMLRTVQEERAHLPPEVRDDTAWATLPSAVGFAEKFGPIGAETRGVRATGAYAVPDVARPDAVPPPATIVPPPTQPEDRVEGKLDPDDPLDRSAPYWLRDGRTLLVLRGGTTVAVGKQDLVVKRRREELIRIPLTELDQILVQSRGVLVSSYTLWRLVGRSISVVIASPVSDEVGVMSAAGGDQGRLRVQQTRKIAAGELDRAAVHMLTAKLANQASVLRYLGRSGARKQSSVGRTLVTASDQIRETIARLEQAANEPAVDAAQWAARLMGHEGAAAAKYWSALAHLVPDDLKFPGRRTRNASDAINMALNYTYGILYGDVWRAVTRAGLDPGVGILHAAPRSPGGLVYDLIEELRAPMADLLVFTLLGRGWHPTVDGKALASLSPRDRHILARAFVKRRRKLVRKGRGHVRLSDLPWLQARALRDLILGETDAYQAFRFQW